MGSRKAIAMLLLAGMGACLQPAPTPHPSELPPGPDAMRWPAPPAEARVVHLGEIKDEDGFVPPRPWYVRAWRGLLGRRGERLLRPAALCVRGDRLAIADPGRPAVHLLDLRSREWRTLLVAADGPLVSPVGVLLLPDGRLLVSDSSRRAIFAYDRAGAPLGRFTTATLGRPTGLALDEGREWVWVSDTLGHRLRAFDLSGQEVASVGSRGAAPGRFNYPTYLAVDPAGGIWVSDSLNFRLQRVRPSADGVDRHFGIAGDRAGAFARPRGLAVDSRGRVLVVDALFDSVQIFDSDGRLLLVFGGRGIDPGRFWLPADVALDGRSRLYVADSYNGRIQIFSYRPPDA